MRKKYQRISFGLFMFFFSFLIMSNISSAMELNISLSTGQSLKINVNSEDTVKKLKDKIFDITEISYLNQGLYKGNQKLNDKKTLASYGIKDGDTLNLSLELQSSPTSRGKSGVMPILIMLAVILAIGIYFMRKKPSADYKP
jgi:hypothetical protein